MNKPLRMGHQTENITLLVADAGNIEHRAIGVGRIRPLGRTGLLVIFSSADPVGQCNLTVFTQPVNHVRIAKNEASFAMGHRRPQVPRASFAMLSGAIEKSALIRLDTQMDPAILKLSGDVLYQRCSLVPLPPRKNTETNQDLESVADADDKLALIYKRVQVIGQPGAQLVGQHRTRAKVISVRESPRDRKNVEIREGILPPEQTSDMPNADLSASKPEGVGRLFIAVHPRGSQYEDFSHPV